MSSFLIIPRSNLKSLINRCANLKNKTTFSVINYVKKNSEESKSLFHFLSTISYIPKNILKIFAFMFAIILTVRFSKAFHIVGGQFDNYHTNNKSHKNCTHKNHL